MEVSYQSLRSRFKQLESNELIEKYKTQDLTDLARQAIIDILKERRITFDASILPPKVDTTPSPTLFSHKNIMIILSIVSLCVSAGTMLIQKNRDKIKTESSLQSLRDLQYSMENIENLAIDNLITNPSLTSQEKIIVSSSIQKQVEEMNKHLPKEAVEGFLRFDNIDVDFKNNYYIQNYTILDTVSYDIDSSISYLIKKNYCTDEMKNFLSLSKLNILYRFQDADKNLLKESISTDIICE